jgi:hypothetical protein
MKGRLLLEASGNKKKIMCTRLSNYYYILILPKVYTLYLLYKIPVSCVG